MHAIRIDGQPARPRLDAAAPAPTPAPGEAVVRVARVAVSASDLQIARARVAFTGIPGQEFVGVVESVSVPDDAPAFLRERRAMKGKRVVASASVLCGACDMCRTGLSAHCRARRVLGLAGRDGAMAELVAVPVANLHAVPDAVPDERAVFTLPLARAMHAAQLAGAGRVAGKERFVTVLGDTPLALLAVQVLALQNKSARLLADGDAAQRLCERWGVKHRPTGEAGRRQDQDAVIDATGDPAAGLRLAMQFVRPRGAIVLSPPGAAPPYPPGVPFPESGAGGPDLGPLAANEIVLTGCRDGSVAEALALLVRDVVDAGSLISRRVKLDDAPAAIAAAAKDAGLVTLIEP